VAQVDLVQVGLQDLLLREIAPRAAQGQEHLADLARQGALLGEESRASKAAG